MKKPRLGLIFGTLHFIMWCALGLCVLAWLNVHHQKFLVTAFPFVMALWLGVTIVSWSVFNWLFKFLSSQPKTYPPEVKVQDNGRLEVDVKALLETPEGRRAIEQLKKRIDDEITKETYGKWPQ